MIALHYNNEPDIYKGLFKHLYSFPTCPYWTVFCHPTAIAVKSISFIPYYFFWDILIKTCTYIVRLWLWWREWSHCLLSYM